MTDVDSDLMPLMCLCVIQIFGFYGDMPDVVRVQYVRRNDNDMHTIDFANGDVKGKAGHWMSGSYERTPVPLEEVVPAEWNVQTPDGLFNRWFDTTEWLKSGQAVLVRPGEEDAPNVPYLCPEARSALESGNDLVLAVGDSIHYRLPGGVSFFIAGLIIHRNQIVAFIIPEKAVRITRQHGLCFSGKIVEDESEKVKKKRAAILHMSRRQRPWFTDGMYDWDSNDVYKYRAGPW